MLGLALGMQCQARYYFAIEPISTTSSEMMDDPDAIRTNRIFGPELAARLESATMKANNRIGSPTKGTTRASPGRAAMSMTAVREMIGGDPLRHP